MTFQTTPFNRRKLSTQPVSPTTPTYEGTLGPFNVVLSLIPIGPTEIWLNSELTYLADQDDLPIALHVALHIGDHIPFDQEVAVASFTLDRARNGSIVAFSTIVVEQAHGSADITLAVEWIDSSGERKAAFASINESW